LRSLIAALTAEELESPAGLATYKVAPYRNSPALLRAAAGRHTRVVKRMLAPIRCEVRLISAPGEGLGRSANKL
jgi:hypothetical protein